MEAVLLIVWFQDPAHYHGDNHITLPASPGLDQSIEAQSLHSTQNRIYMPMLPRLDLFETLLG